VKTSRHAVLIAYVAGALLGCSLMERADLLVGRACEPTLDAPCDPGQACLPHQRLEGRYEDHRCRDRRSFEPTNGEEAPLAFCDEAAGYVCPGDLICNADRIRADGGPRPRVCKLPDDLFGPPLDGGALDGGDG
jgi:hypothetical protein